MDVTTEPRSRSGVFFVTHCGKLRSLHYNRIYLKNFDMVWGSVRNMCPPSCSKHLSHFPRHVKELVGATGPCRTRQPFQQRIRVVAEKTLSCRPISRLPTLLAEDGKSAV